ncbi:non-ribosomal peptide synthetase/type I polyketide synthase [Acidicapsa dinghuensis]|uniref:Non-ribosomal peptide synthetase/type I polyketide synthase n=1 Tax=Acidicapsa dinghuensis TaxID=2218256 RepID=A0ABW1EDF3_9BACT|nr:non-ribosomal peptide synthetase/type I polyketide synthase [Acidicapsa dinghuensis]
MSDLDQEKNLDGVAIIGMSGRFPGAPDLETFWANVLAGKDTIKRFTREELEARNTAAVEFGSDYVPAHGVLEDAEYFDSSFFGISPRDADYLDPQHRVFLEASWSALEDAGYDPAKFPGQIGVFAGCSLNTYLLANISADRAFLDELTGNYQVGEFQAALGNDKDFLCTRVAYKLNLGGPCLSVQAACATSLVAISQAAQNLLTYQCDMALAGGVSITFPQHRGYTYQEGSMGSRDGMCRPFDADATGTIFGHGVGVVVLKRLEDAVADGDRIDAVIRGFAVNNDGAAKVGYMAPGVDGQSTVIAAAQAMAGVSADDISYVEAHGTATPLGDPIEVAALTRAFRESTKRVGYCAIGSTKANIGHLDAAAGVSGVIKTVLAMRHKTIPPVAHFQTPNPRIDFASTPFYVNRDAMAWEPGHSRVAGVSAFGVGGVNSHLVLEEFAVDEASQLSSRPAELLCVSARSESALQTALSNLGRHLEQHPEIDLGDVAYTLETGRRAFDYRAAVVAENVAEAIQLLKEPANRRIAIGQRGGSSSSASPGAAFLFTGQGSQFPGMGRVLYETEAVYRDEVNSCAAFLKPLLGVDLRTLLFPESGSADSHAEALAETRIAQPALFVTELAMAQLWQSWGIEPKAVAGHSLGEFVAAVVAGVMSREDGLRLVTARGDLMQRMERGSMLSVRLSEEQIVKYLNESLSIAAINSPMLCVVSGSDDAIQALEEKLTGENIGCRRLRTSHAFHSAMMEPMLDEFEAEVRRVALHAPTIPYVSAVAGQWITAEQATDPKYWREHCRKPVRFADVLNLLLDQPDTVLLEVGPGQTLTTLAHQQRGSRKTAIVASMPDREAENLASSTMREALGKLWIAGIEPDWKRFWSGESRRRVSLPTYPFERRKHWIEPPVRTTAVESTHIPSTFPTQTDIRAEREPVMPVNAQPAVAERKIRLQPIVAGLFEELSGVATGPESYDASFLELGFDSLFLTQVTQALQRRFKVKVTFRQIVEEFSSIRALSEHLDAKLPADAFPAETPQTASAPVAASTSVAAASAAIPSAPIAGFTTPPGSALEELMRAQMQAMTQLFEQQLAAVRGVTAVAAPQQAAVVTTPVTAPKVVAPAAAPSAASSGEIKAHGPFKPVQAGSKDGLTDQQREFVQKLTERYTKRTAKSKAYTETYRPHLADPRAVAGFRSLWKEMVYPVVANRSKGSRIWDLDGNEYIDIVNGFGAIMFGHSPDFVTEAVRHQIDLGVEIGPQSALAGEVAAMICESTGLERAAFCNTGSEAVMAAMRVARTVTARDTVVYFTGDYHGTFDEVLLRATPSGAQPIAPGILASGKNNIVILEYGAEASLEYIRKHSDEIAAVMVEPIQSRHPELQPRAFLHELRKITADAGTALIFDEVVTGFRVALGGAQEYYGIRADLATYGKVIGGGYPIGVVAGKREYLDALDGGQWQYGDDSAPEAGMTFFAGTFVRHPLAMAAAKSVLGYLKKEGPELQQTLARKVAAAARGVEDGFREAELDIEVHPCGAWFMFHMPSDARFGSLLHYLMREKGVHVLESYPCFFTTSHSDADFARVVETFREAALELRRGGMLPDPVGTTVSVPESLDAADEMHAEARPGNPDGVPLTESQREIWLAAALSDEANCAFNESMTLRLHGVADEKQIEKALEAAIHRHDALRSTIDPDGEWLRIGSEVKIEIPFVDLSALSAEDRAAVLEKRAAEEASLPFDLVNGPLLRATLFRTASNELVLLMTGHHIVLDGWSANQLLEDMGCIYGAALQHGKPALAPLLPFSSYALREQEDTQAGAYEENERYWVDMFNGRAPVLDLPLDRPRSAVKTYGGSTLNTKIGPELYNELKKASSKLGCTLYVTLLSGFQLLLHKLTGQQEVVVGISAAGQSVFDNSSLVGHCVHFLPMLSELPKPYAAKDHISVTRKRLLDAYDHQEFTYGTLLRKLKIPRDASRLPLIEVQFNLEKLGSNVHFEGLRVEMNANPKAFVNTDLFLNIVESNDGLSLSCDYNADLLDQSTLERWMSSYATLLHEIAVDAGRDVEGLNILDAAERQLVVEEWNRTAVDFGRFEAVHRAFERQAAQTPFRVAVVCNGEEWTYQQLNEYSNRMARHLRRNGIQDGSLVAICVERSHSMLGAVLAVLKAGAAYLPLDPSHPTSRLEMVLADAQVALVLTQEHLAHSLHTSSRVVCVDSEQQLWARESGTDLDGADSPNALAYVIYTSGSTGRPKGVAIEHGALTNLLRSMEQKPGLQSQDVWVSVTTLSFDIAALEIFLPLMVGARVVIATRDQVIDGNQLLKLAEQSQATVLQATPSGWRMMLEAGWQGQPRLKVLCGGEALPHDLAEQLLERSDEVWNMYGPTETTIWSSATKLEKPVGQISVGPPIANTQFYVVDDRLQPVPMGVAGELCIGGDGLARGYWHRPELTEEKFVNSPFDKGRIYRTGDLARWHANGRIELLGRTDFQVKIRGFRIELGEIEAALASHPEVRDAVTLAVEVRPGDKRLAAWVDSASPEPPADLSDQLYALLGAKLPEYMRPAVITILQSLPRTANGKIDRKALPAPSFAANVQQRVYHAPETPEQEKLARIWADVLNLERVSITDSIFELGADSLLIFRISARAGREGLPIQPTQIFQHRTIANLAKVIGEAEATENGPKSKAITAVARDRFRRSKI